MTDSELRKVMDKLHKLKVLRDARERVRQLERELCGEPAKAEGARLIPGFLSQGRPLRVG